MKALTRIFHDKSIPTCAKTMPTALDLNFDWGGMKHTATASKSFVRLVSMVLGLRLTTIYHEIFGLIIFTIIFFFPSFIQAATENLWNALMKNERFNFVIIADPNNEADSETGFGKVANTFEMGMYQVTAAQYALFLNAVTPNENLYQLYDERMGSDPAVACITCNINENPHYKAIPGRENFPITYVDLFCAVRFCNWLSHDCISNNPSITENGSYMIHHDFNSEGVLQEWIEENSHASYCLPNEDQWYKAAYYNNGKEKMVTYDPENPIPSVEDQSSFYWNYPTKSMEAPCNNVVKASAWGWEVSQVANYFDSKNEWYPKYTTDEWSYWDCYYVHYGSYLTSVGNFPTSCGPYGTFDMGGNVDEWTFSKEGGKNPEEPFCAIRGGSWTSTAQDLERHSHRLLSATTKNNTTGFRVAYQLVPENIENINVANQEEVFLGTIIDSNTTAACSQIEGVADCALFGIDFIAQEAFEMALVYDAKEGFRLREYLLKMIPAGMMTTALDWLLFGFQNATEWGGQWILHMLGDSLGLAAIDYFGTQETKALALQWGFKPVVDFYEALHEGCHNILDPMKKKANAIGESVIGWKLFSENCGHNHGPNGTCHASKEKYENSNKKYDQYKYKLYPVSEYDPNNLKEGESVLSITCSKPTRKRIKSIGQKKN